jgi:hypothetical protein
VDARDLFIKGDRHLEPSEGRPQADQGDPLAFLSTVHLVTGPLVTGGPSGGEHSLRLPWGDTSELVQQYLTFQDPAQVSSLMAVLRDARAATGRSEETGLLQAGQEARAGHWLGALGYMVTIEHIGKCFRPRGAPLPPRPGFRRALVDFAPHLTEKERDALYALRCCFAHDYSLVNGPEHTSRNLWYRFTLNADEQTPLVEGPSEQWNGDLASSQSRTRVNLRKVGDLAEEVVRAVVRTAERDELELNLPGGVNDLRLRYTLFLGSQS